MCLPLETVLHTERTLVLIKEKYESRSVDKTINFKQTYYFCSFKSNLLGYLFREKSRILKKYCNIEGKIQKQLCNKTTAKLAKTLPMSG